jgi:hypothetical protein
MIIIFAPFFLMWYFFVGVGMIICGIFWAVYWLMIMSTAAVVFIWHVISSIIIAARSTWTNIINVNLLGDTAMKHQLTVDAPSSTEDDPKASAHSFAELEQMLQSAKDLGVPSHADYSVRIKFGGRIRQITFSWSW